MQRRPNDQRRRGHRRPPGPVGRDEGRRRREHPADGERRRRAASKVPDVAGQTFEDAQAALEAEGLKVERQDEASDTVDAGEVTRTEPARGRDASTGARDGARVRLGRPGAGQRAERRGHGPGRGDADAEQRRLRVPEGERAEQHRRRRARSSAPNPRGRHAGAARQHRDDQRVDRARAGRPSPTWSARPRATPPTTLTNAGFDVTVVQVPSSPSNTGQGDHAEPGGRRRP